MRNSKIVLKWNIFILSITTSHQALGDVNMKDSSFFKTWIDHVIKRDRRDLKIKRSYKSRSLHHGLFGFGWCSDLDASLNVLNKSQVELKDCNTDRPLRFIKAASPEANTYLAEGRAQDILILSDKIFIRKSNGITTQRFNSDGSQLFDKNLIQNVVSNSSGQITEIKFADNTAVKYRYMNGDLINVEKNGELIFKYEYDDLHNLTKILYPDRSFELVEYDKDRDWIKSHTGRNRCVENYRFEMPEAKNQNYFVSTVTKKCKSSPPQHTQYEFWHKSNADGKLYLDRVKISANESTTEVSYHPLSGAAIRLHSKNPSRTAAFEKSIKGEIHEAYQPELPTNH